VPSRAAQRRELQDRVRGVEDPSGRTASKHERETRELARSKKPSFLGIPQVYPIRVRNHTSQFVGSLALATFVRPVCVFRSRGTD
jgi:hypothetical protein